MIPRPALTFHPVAPVHPHAFVPATLPWACGCAGVRSVRTRGLARRRVAMMAQAPSSSSSRSAEDANENKASTGGETRLSPDTLSSSAETADPNATSDPNGTSNTTSNGSSNGNGAAARQLLGIKGASQTTDKWRIHLQLMKPVTWVPLIWGVTCGAAASGRFHWSSPEQIEQSLVCMFLAGPLLTGYTQVLNDWYDRHIDAINEPYRPIPAGLVKESDVKIQIAVLLFASYAVSYALDLWAHHDWPVNLALAVFGSFISYIYSAPPLKLKQNGWLGSYALGASYISLPWWAGQALFGKLDWKVMLLTLFYSFAGLGIAIVNDFKSVEGDRKLGMKSLPVMFGIDKAKWICVALIDLFQLLVAAVIFAEHEAPYAAGIVGLVLPQIFLQFKYFLKDPVENDVKYQAAAQPFLVIGILVAGLAVGHHGPL